MERCPKSRTKGVLILLFGFSLFQPKGGVAQGTLPIVDLHFHSEEGWEDFQALIGAFDDAGVVRACNGVRRDPNPTAPDRLALLFAQNLPDRYIPYAGQGILRLFMTAFGEEAWTLQRPEVLNYLGRLGRQVRIGLFTGIGEIFVNSLNSTPLGVQGLKFPANSPLMQRLWAFSATFNIPLSVHMEAASDSVAEMEELLASNRKGTWLWAHGGFSQRPELSGKPSLLKALLDKHPNLYIELSTRHRPLLRPPGILREDSLVDTSGTLQEEWRNLLESKSDRFVIGSDAGRAAAGNPAEYKRVIDVWRGIIAQLSAEAAGNIAHRNADRLSLCDQRVFTDIKPGSLPNSVNPKSQGKIPVAMLSTRLLDGTIYFDVPSRVDPASLTFGRTGDEQSLAFCDPRFEDVNGDGDLDLVCHFNTPQTGFQAGDTDGVLRGQTFGGAPLRGRDSVRIVPPK